MRRPSDKPVPFAAALIAAAVVAVGIFALTGQAADVSAYESRVVGEFLVGLFGGVPFLYDPATDLWLGIGIRHWAHVAEYCLLGALAASAAWLATKPRLAVAGAASLAACAAFSLFDQLHRLFVPGRHFDAFDLVMDALGYVPAILVVLLVARAIARRRRR